MFLFILHESTRACVRGYEPAMARVWRSEDIFLKSILSFHCVSPNSSRFILLGGRHFFPLRHLADLEVNFLVIAIFSLRSPGWREADFC